MLYRIGERIRLRKRLKIDLAFQVYYPRLFLPFKNVLSQPILDSSIVFDPLMTDYQANSKQRVYNYRNSGRVEYQEFYPSESKPIIDDIDSILSEHYGFTDEELDFIINYDVKYRMGLGS